MGTVTTTATDLRYGRRGGRWLPDGYESPEPRTCPVCAGPMLAGQDVHLTCAPALLTLFGDD